MAKSRAPNPTDLLKEIVDSKSCPPVFLITGAEKIRLERAVEFLLNGLVPGWNNQSSRRGSNKVMRIAGSDLSISKINALATEICTASLFASEKFYIITDVEQTKAAEANALAQIIPKIPPFSRIIFTAAKTPAAKLNDAINKHGKGVGLPELKGYELKRWVEKEMKAEGITKFDEETVEAIVNLTGGSADEIAPLVKQLGLFVDGSVVLDDLKVLFPQQTQTSDFDLVDAIVEKNRKKAELLLAAIFAEGRNAFPLLALLIRSWMQFKSHRIMHDKGLDSGAVRSALGITPWLYSKQQRLMRYLPIERIERDLWHLLEADTFLKGRSIGQEGVFINLVARMAT